MSSSNPIPPEDEGEWLASRLDSVDPKSDAFYAANVAGFGESMGYGPEYFGGCDYDLDAQLPETGDER